MTKTNYDLWVRTIDLEHEIIRLQTIRRKLMFQYSNIDILGDSLRISNLIRRTNKLINTAHKELEEISCNIDNFMVK